MADTSDAALAASLPGDFRSGYAEVNGTRIHYVEGGKGTPVLLLPGWPETWWEFHKIMPERTILTRSCRSMQATPFSGGPYRRSYGPILKRCGTISWVPSRCFPV